MSDDMMNFETSNKEYYSSAKYFYESMFDEDDMGKWDELSDKTKEKFNEFYSRTIEVELDWKEMFIKNGVRFEMKCPENIVRKGKEELFNVVVRGSDWENMLNDEIWTKVLEMDGKVKTEFKGDSFMGYVFDMRDWDDVDEFLGECEYWLDDMPEHYLTHHIFYSGSFTNEQTEFCHMMDSIKDAILWSIDEEELEAFLIEADIESEWDYDKDKWDKNSLSVLLNEEYFGLDKDEPVVLDFYKSVSESSELADKWNIHKFIEVSYV